MGDPAAPLVVVVPGFLSETPGVYGMRSLQDGDSGAADWYRSTVLALSGTRCRALVFTWRAEYLDSLARAAGVTLGVASPAIPLFGAVAPLLSVGALAAAGVWNRVLINCFFAASGLAEAIEDERGEVALIGHSLGARVILRALARSTRRARCVALLGAAVGQSELGRTRRRGIPSPPATDTPIDVVFSKGDTVLAQLFPVGLPTRGAAIGFAGVQPTPPGMRNVDAEALIGERVGHLDYRIALGRVLSALPAWQDLRRDFPATAP